MSGFSQYQRPADLTAWIEDQRPSRAAVDPLKPSGFFQEQEPDADGKIVASGCILLTNKECPWRCLMCDLWRHTLRRSVPPGAIPRQIDYALAQFGTRSEQIKLYNSGSFFDPSAIPCSDYAPIAQRLQFARHLVVESHPRLVGDRALRLRDLFAGSLEVALGLETIHPQVLPLLNKRINPEHFARAAEFLGREGIAVRAFLLVKPPFLDEIEAVEWAVKSAEFAFACGAAVVSFIPTRPGNGALDRLMETGEFSPPRLSTLERSLEVALSLSKGRVFADTWNLEEFSRCSICFDKRKARLHAMNLTQTRLPAVACAVCGGA